MVRVIDDGLIQEVRVVSRAFQRRFKSKKSIIGVSGYGSFRIGLYKS